MVCLVLLFGNLSIKEKKWLGGGKIKLVVLGLQKDGMKLDHLLHPVPDLVDSDPMIGNPGMSMEQLILSNFRKVFHKDGAQTAGKAAAKYWFHWSVLGAKFCSFIVFFAKVVVCDDKIDLVFSNTCVEHGAHSVFSWILREDEH